MYHARFKGRHYEAGLKWGQLLLKNGIKLDYNPTFKLTEERIRFAEKCLDEYKRFFPEVLDEIRGIAGVRADVRADGTPSPMLKDRLLQGIALYDMGASDRLLMSGDIPKSIMMK
jgi:hypothetical protein